MVADTVACCVWRGGGREVFKRENNRARRHTAEEVAKQLSLSIARKWYNVQELEPVYMRLSHGCALLELTGPSIARKWYNVQELEPVYRRLSHGCVLPLWKLTACLYAAVTRLCSTTMETYRSLSIARKWYNVQELEPVYRRLSLSIARKWYNVQELEPVYRRLSHGCALQLWKLTGGCHTAVFYRYGNLQVTKYSTQMVQRTRTSLFIGGCHTAVLYNYGNLQSLFIGGCHTAVFYRYGNLQVTKYSTQMVQRTRTRACLYAAVTRLCSTTMETCRSLSIARKWYNVQELEPVYRRLSLSIARKWYNVQELEPVYRRLSHGCALQLWKLTGGCHTAVFYRYGNLQVTKYSTQMVQRTRTRACLYAAVTRLCSTTMETCRSLSIARKWYNVQELEPVYRRLSLSIARKWYNVQELEPVYRRLSHGCALQLWKLTGGCHTAVLYHYGNLQVTKSSTQMVQRTRTRACLYAAVTRLCSTTMETCRSLSIARKWYNVQELEPVYMRLSHGCALQLWKLAGGCHTAVLYNYGNLQVTKYSTQMVQRTRTRACLYAAVTRLCSTTMETCRTRACLYAAVTRLCSTTMETCRSLSIARKRYNVQGLEPVTQSSTQKVQRTRTRACLCVVVTRLCSTTVEICRSLSRSIHQLQGSQASQIGSRSGHSASKKFLVEFGFPPLKVMAHFLTCQDVVQLTSVLLSPPTCQPSSPIVSCSPAVPVPLIIDSHSTCSCRPAPACLSVLAGENLYLSCYRQNMKS
ncbi:hypothetical protein J6590_078027 [Homalodisca vitripennis]|nr:hypothetical protein J6590_078027 [Homalodisca vitripennis]